MGQTVRAVEFGRVRLDAKRPDDGNAHLLHYATDKGITYLTPLSAIATTAAKYRFALTVNTPEIACSVGAFYCHIFFTVRSISSELRGFWR